MSMPMLTFIDPTTGLRRRLSVAQAMHSGLVDRRSDGLLIYTPRGRKLNASVPASSRSARPDTTSNAPDSASHRIVDIATSIGKAARYPMLGSSLLKIAQSNGTPPWQTMYFAANGMNRILGGTWMPTWLSSGPVKIAIEAALLLPALESSFDALPAAHAHLRAARSHNGNSVLRAAVSRMPSSPASTPPLSHHNIPALASVFRFIRPLYQAGMTMSCISGILDLPAYLLSNGTRGLLSTQSGRAAWIGAISSAAMLGAMWMPASPLAAYVDLASNVLWGAELVNGHGWLDGILGSDPPGSS